jgi:hypothetical protein
VTHEAIMSLLQEIQSGAIDENVEIVVVLRKCKVLAAKLGNEEFKSWVDYELNGYPSIKEVPDYRIIRGVKSYGSFVGIGWSQMKNIPIPASGIPDEYQDAITILHLTEPISYFSSLVNQKHDELTINLGWPGDLVAYCSDKILDGGWCLINAWRVIAISSLVSLLDTVRNRVLSFALEIEEEAPDAGEALPGQKPIAEERVQQVFNTYIMQGGTAQIAAGNQTIKYDINIQVIQNDFDSLKRFLSSLEVGEDDIQELGEAIQKDKKYQKETGFGKKVQTWLGKMISKAADGSWKIATSVAANLLTKALMQYYGI